MQYRAMRPGIEVFGAGIEVMLKSFRILPSVGNAYLAKYGLAAVGPDGMPTFDRAGWHPQGAWLRMFEAIAGEVGATSLYEIGRTIGAMDLTGLPAKDVSSRLRSLELGYHLAHRCDGTIMYDAATGTLLEGIGHYRSTPVRGEKKVIVTCDTPYPCEFDHGILSAAMAQVEPKAKATHAVDGPCRKKGADSCTYFITW